MYLPANTMLLSLTVLAPVHHEANRQSEVNCTLADSSLAAFIDF